MPTKTSRLPSGVLVAAIMLLISAGTCAAAEPAFDVLIRGGMVIDGTGAPPQRLDVGIRGAHIETLGTLSDAQAKHVIDATGLASSVFDSSEEVSPSEGELSISWTSAKT